METIAAKSGRIYQVKRRSSKMKAEQSRAQSSLLLSRVAVMAIAVPISIAAEVTTATTIALHREVFFLLSIESNVQLFWSKNSLALITEVLQKLEEKTYNGSESIFIILLLHNIYRRVFLSNI